MKGERVGGVPARQIEQIFSALKQTFVTPTRVAVMGQTGVGKSSLINALFGCRLETGDVTPTTRVPAEVRQELPDGRSITFVDLPGIGESKVADQDYLEMYKSELQSADILLWLFSAESRSLLTDMECIAALARDEHSRGLLSAKVSFALTKADLVAHPWLLSHDGEHASFTPHPDKHHLLTAKAEYVQEMLRLGDIRVAITSTVFRYGLLDLLSSVLTKTEDGTIWRIGSLLDVDSLGRLDLGDALRCRNFLIHDQRSNELS